MMHAIVSPHTHAPSERGFTMFAVAIVIAVIGLAIAALLPDIIKTQYDPIVETQARMARIRDAMYVYAAANGGSIPCPTTTIGSALSSNAPPTSPTVSSAVAACGASGPTSPGEVPVKTLGLSEDYALDGWGKKIRYVVDARYTYTPIPTNGISNIAVIGNGVNPRYPNGDLFYLGGTGQVVMGVLISSGADGARAYLRSGMLDGTIDMRSIEYENIDREVALANDASDNNTDGINEATFVSDVFSNAQGAGMNDDIVEGILNIKNCEPAVPCAASGSASDLPIGCVAGLGNVSRIAEGEKVHGTVRSVTCVGAGAPTIQCTNGVWVVTGVCS
jgi:type II secretory pathway pseudopilin PulG